MFLRMDHISEGRVQDLVRGRASRGARALWGEWRGAGQGERFVNLQISVADRCRNTRGTVFRPVVDARPDFGSGSVLCKRV